MKYVFFSIYAITLVFLTDITARFYYDTFSSSKAGGAFLFAGLILIMMAAGFGILVGLHLERNNG